MRPFVAAAGLAAGASAAVLPRQDQCCFQLTASGGQSGVVGQLGDGQNRVGGSYPAGTYCLSGSAITDAKGRGCILTPPTTQLQCDQGATPDSGFSVSDNGELLHNGDSTFYACAAADGEYNIYTETSDAQTQCSKITLNTGGQCSGNGNGGASSQPASQPASQPSSIPATSLAGYSSPETSQSAPETSPAAPESTKPAESAPGYSCPAQSVATQTVTEQNTAPAEQSVVTSTVTVQNTATPEQSVVTTTVTEQSSCPAPSAVTSTVTEQNSCPPQSAITTTVSDCGAGGPPGTSAPPAGVPSSTWGSPSQGEDTQPPPVPTGSAPGGYSPQPATASQPAPTGSAPGGYPTTAASETQPAPTASGPSGQTTQPPSQTQPSAGGPGSGSGSACQTSLVSGSYETPHLIVPVNSDSPDESYGTSYNAYANGQNSTVFNFDIPQSDEGKTCSLVFLFPKKEDLETTDYTFNGQGSLEFAQLSGAVDESTTYSSCPSKQQDLGSVTPQPGGSYVVQSGPCAAGTTETVQMTAGGGLELEFFEDWNPSPLGLFITVC